MACIYDNITKKICNNDKGIALVSALILGSIGMLMVASLLLMVGDTGSWISGSKTRYQVALAAAHGGMNFFVKEIIQKGLRGDSLTKTALGDYDGLLAMISDANLPKKLTETGRLGVGTYPGNKPDVTMTFAIPNGPNITINTTIKSTGRGNSGTSSNILEGGGVVDNNSGKITPQHIPYIYQIETEGQNAANSIKYARLSAIYAY